MANWGLRDLQSYNTNTQLNDMAMGLPGYKQLGEQYDRINQADFPDYMDKFAGMVGTPQDMMSQLYGGDDGAYGPIGADELKQFGEGAYELFDQFKPGMEYIAENQGVGEQELTNQLGVASSGYQANIANQAAQEERRMGRMGMDPSSGAWAASAGDRAMEGAAGLSGLQQGVRQGARERDWKERMEAAGIGLNLAGQGTNAMSQAAGAYGNAASNLSNMYGNYMQGIGNMGNLTENARQYNYSQAGGLASGMTGARPAMDQTNYGQFKPQMDTYSGF